MKTARQEILDKLKSSVHPVPEKPDFDSPVYPSINTPLDLAFRENLEKVNGIVHLCSSEKELLSKLKNFLLNFEKHKVVCFEKKITELLKKSGYPITEFSEVPENIEVGITGCEYLVAHTGSVMVSSAQKGGRQMFVYPPVHIIVARHSQLVGYLENAYENLIKKYDKDLPSHVSLITGPSRTADIEKTMVMGAHGPRELHVFLT